MVKGVVVMDLKSFDNNYPNRLLNRLFVDIKVFSSVLIHVIRS